jgi:hypothetical protein
MSGPKRIERVGLASKSMGLRRVPFEATVAAVMLMSGCGDTSGGQSARSSDFLDTSLASRAVDVSWPSTVRSMQEHLGRH